MAVGGARRTIRLGKVPKRFASAWIPRVEELAEAMASGTPARGETLRWVRELPDGMRERLERAGLVKTRERATLGEWVRRYIREREADTKASTRTAYGRGRAYLFEFFGEACALEAITAGDAERWRRWLTAPRSMRVAGGIGGKGAELAGRGVAENTARRSVGFAKQWFRAAIRAGLIEANPFADLAAVVMANPKRMAFVGRETAQRVLDACPDAEWRLLFALARYGGLRIPSEAQALRWGDIDLAGGRFVVRSSKTEKHEAGGIRVVPIFPELRPYLEDARELAPEGAEFVIERYRDETQNLRTQLQRIIARAGVVPWPKLWQNLRSTRETELAEKFPIQAVTAWIGNSEAVARKHYLQVTDEHFARAAGMPAADAAESSEASSDGSSVSRVARGVARIPARATSDRSRIERNGSSPPSGATLGESSTRTKTPETGGNPFQASSGPYWNGTTPQFPEEISDSRPGWRAFRRADPAEADEIDEELAALASAWPALPPAIRSAILTLAAASEWSGPQ